MTIQEAITERPVWFDQRDELELKLAGIIEADLQHFGVETLYIPFTSEMPCEFHRSLRGLASPAYAHIPLMREAIGNRWRGSGLILLVNDANFCGAVPDSALCNLKAVAVHEAAHYFSDFAGLYGVNSISDAVIAPKHIVQGFIDDWKLDPRREGRSRVDARLTHNAQFVRACLHLVYRLETRGIEVDLYDLMNWKELGYRGVINYWRELMPEMEECLDLPLSEILKRLLPEQFGAHWLNDCVAFEGAVGFA